MRGREDWSRDEAPATERNGDGDGGKMGGGRGVNYQF